MKFHKLARAVSAISSATISPARTPGVATAFATSMIAPTRTIVRHASPNSNLRLKSMLFHASVQRAAAQPQLPRCQRDVEMVQSKRALDHLPFELIEVEAVGHDRQRRCSRSRWQREVLAAVM